MNITEYYFLVVYFIVFYFRYYVLYMLPKLNFLDSTPVTEAERKEAQRVGQYTKVVSSDFKNDVRISLLIVVDFMSNLVIFKTVFL